MHSNEKTTASQLQEQGSHTAQRKIYHGMSVDDVERFKMNCVHNAWEKVSVDPEEVELIQVYEELELATFLDSIVREMRE